MSDDELKRVQAIADALLDSYQNGVNEGLEFGKTERERLREENARLRGEVADLRATLRNCLTDSNFMRAAAAAIREGGKGD